MTVKDRNGSVVEYRIVPYKNRRIDGTHKVRVYRNINKEGLTYSIMQKGVVVGHTEAIMLVDAKFIVNEGGRQRVLASGKKNVHAYIEGYLIRASMGIGPHEGKKLSIPVYYNPYKTPKFITPTARTVDSALFVCINEHGVTVVDINGA